MNNTGRILSALAFVAGAANVAAGQSSVTQTVSFEVQAINQIAVFGSPSLVISSATAGSAPTSVTSAVSTWAVTTNQSGAKVTANLDAAMASGVTLSANLAAPSGASSQGLQALGTVAVDVVTGLTKQNAAALGITYTLDATSAAGVVAAGSRIVTYTITGGT
jgi:hypothetical protein